MPSPLEGSAGHLIEMPPGDGALGAGCLADDIETLGKLGDEGRQNSFRSSAVVARGYSDPALLVAVPGMSRGLDFDLDSFQTSELNELSYSLRRS